MLDKLSEVAFLLWLIKVYALCSNHRQGLRHTELCNFKCFLPMVVIFTFVSVNMVFVSFRQFLFTIKYDLVDLGKYSYLGPIIASLC